MSKVYRVFITGIAIREDGEQPPDHWPVDTLVHDMHSIECEARLLEDDREWPSKEKPKRAYTCSICGGRHSARFCPHRFEEANNG